MSEKFIDGQYLIDHPDHIFVFGDNILGVGYGGAAALRDYENSYGFITKLEPNDKPDSYFRPAEYAAIYCDQMQLLIQRIRSNPGSTFLISKLGAGLANRYHIWEEIIEPTIKHLLAPYPNVEFLW